MLLPAALLAGLITMLLAAKAHGREVRLEREAAGYHDVEFGGTNPPFVEALWQRDRVVYWTTLPIGLLISSAALYVARGGWSLALLAAPLLSAIAAFTVSGLRHPTGWRGAGRAGSALWWGLTAVGLAAAIALLV